MFPSTYFSPTFFASQYWPPAGDVAVPPTPPPPTGPHGGAQRRKLRGFRHRLRTDTRLTLDELMAEIDFALLETEIERAALEKLAGLPTHEPSGRAQRAPKVDIDVDAIIRRLPSITEIEEPAQDDFGLRLLLLLGC